MGMFSNIGRIRRLMKEDMNANIGDIAVLKMDGVGMKELPQHTAAMDAIRGYAPALDLEALGHFPLGSFGRAFADFMKRNGLSPFLVSDQIDAEMKARNAFGIRLASTHDLVHVLTDFDTSWAGEMGVYAVQAAQKWSRMSWILGAATWLFYPFFTGFRIPTLAKAWRRGFELGRRAPFLLGERLEDRFEEPLDVVRESYGLTD